MTDALFQRLLGMKKPVINIAICELLYQIQDNFPDKVITLGDTNIASILYKGSVKDTLKRLVERGILIKGKVKNANTYKFANDIL